MNPDLVMRCFGANCERRRDCARYAAYLLATDGAPLSGFNVCDHTHSDRFIPLMSRVHGTHGPLPHTVPTSGKRGGGPNSGGALTSSMAGTHRPAAVCADPTAPVGALANTTGAA